MSATGIGLWLVGVGSFAAALSVAFERPPQGSGGLRFDSPESARPGRISYAIRAVALLFIAVGGATVAVAELPTLWVSVVSVVAFAVAVWLICRMVSAPCLGVKARTP